MAGQSTFAIGTGGVSLASSVAAISYSGARRLQCPHLRRVHISSYPQSLAIKVAIGPGHYVCNLYGAKYKQDHIKHITLCAPGTSDHVSLIRTRLGNVR